MSIFDWTRDWAEAGGVSVKAEAVQPSTNESAKQNAFTEKEALVLYLADHQTKGRGRGQNTWVDQGAGHFLLSSWSLQSRGALQPVTAPALGLALFKSAMATWLGAPWSLKAPNDLYLGTKKVAGLLLETVQEGNKTRLIVGLGMNVFSHPQVDVAGSLHEQIPRNQLGPEIWAQFLDRWLMELTSSLLITQNVLHPTQQQGLQFALNLFPLKKENVNHIEPNGTLRFENGGQKLWSEL